MIAVGTPRHHSHTQHMVHSKKVKSGHDKHGLVILSAQVIKLVGNELCKCPMTWCIVQTDYVMWDLYTIIYLGLQVKPDVSLLLVCSPWRV